MSPWYFCSGGTRCAGLYLCWPTTMTKLQSSWMELTSLMFTQKKRYLRCTNSFKHVYCHSFVLLVPYILLSIVLSTSHLTCMSCGHLFYGRFVVLIRHWWGKEKLHLSWYYTSTSYLISAVHFVQAEILAKFKPHLDTSTLITNIRNIEKAIRDCLDHFKSTRHMILYYEDIISNSNVLNTIRCPTEKKNPLLRAWVN